MVQPGVTGELVPERNPSALAAAIQQLLSDHEHGRQLGRTGRAMAKEKFSIDANVRALAEILARQNNSRTASSARR
jgi:glycosyltransferase involved in cell wall biosynthesis